jgi:hypothetical protein
VISALRAFLRYAAREGWCSNRLAESIWQRFLLVEPRPRNAQLATYLGHLDIRSTQRYLQMTPELLQAASQRFADYALGGDHEG